jgi:hypothetical protein
LESYYAHGHLPNTKGNVKNLGGMGGRKTTLKGGQLQQAPGTMTLGPTMFRCIAGLQPNEVRTLQEKFHAENVLLKKGKKVEGLNDMEEKAKEMKVNHALKVAIVEFYFNRTSQISNWETIYDEYHIGDG